MRRAGYAIDHDPATSWQSQYYLGNPVFGGLKAGSGLPDVVLVGTGVKPDDAPKRVSS